MASGKEMRAHGVPGLAAAMERAWRWARSNLLSTPFNTVLTVLAVALVVLILPPLFTWGLLEADFTGESRSDCTSSGACWVFVTARFDQFIYGFYPAPERWRVDLVFAVPVLAGLWVFWPRGEMRRVPGARSLAVFMLAIYPMLTYVLLRGGYLGLTPVSTEFWGGLMLTLVVAVTGIVASLPLGVLLALGRRSEMPAVRSLSIAFIELWRGVPLISVLFMASVMLPLFLPEGAAIDKLLRALIGVALFSAAYMAEVVRGGLQAIPKGQYEAAMALGLGYWRMMGLVILPQALRHVIPGIVNTFIGLFKDTTLVYIIGLFDLLGTVQTALTDPNWLGFATEGYVFTAAVFWIFTFGMSRYSLTLERKLSREGRDGAA